MPAPTPTSTPHAPIDHYENFPVASWLCPRHLRAPIAAIYHFARTADDLADEGSALPAQRLDDLAAYRADLAAIAAGQAPSPRWQAVFLPLQRHMHVCALPAALLDDLLQAFIQDVHYTRDAATYADWHTLLDYCRRSANPVGRLLLLLYGVHDDTALHQSDAICTALQLYNFWQDISIDVPRQRFYLPQDICNAHGISPRAPHTAAPHAMHALLMQLLDATDALMRSGTPLPQQVAQHAGRRAAWELGLVIQGGLRIGRKTRQLGSAIVRQRPRIGAADAILMLWGLLTHGD